MLKAPIYMKDGRMMCNRIKKQQLKTNKLNKMEKDLQLYPSVMLGDDNDYGAVEVERFEGIYKGSALILDKIYEDEYFDEDGEQYFGSFRWEYSNTEYAAMDENGEEVAIDTIVELIDYMDYSRLKR